MEAETTLARQEYEARERSAQLAETARQFDNQTTFNQWAIQAGYSENERQRAWQSRETELGRGLQREQLAETARQFDNQLAFQQYALESGWTREDIQMAWETKEAEAARGPEWGRIGIQEAELTGELYGTPTLAAALARANLTGVLGDKPTIAGLNASMNRAVAQGQATGTFTDPQTGQTYETLQSIQQKAEYSGIYEGNDTLARVLAEANLTGVFGDIPTIAGLNAAMTRAVQQGQQTGEFVDPVTGQSYETLVKLQQDLDERLGVAGLTGEYEGQPTLAAQRVALDKAGITGTMEDGSKTLAAQVAESQATGNWEGVPTLAALITEAEMTGEWKGEPTITAALNTARVTGDFNGIMTLEAAALTGLFNGKKTLQNLLRTAELTGKLDDVETIQSKLATLEAWATKANITGLYYDETTKTYESTLSREMFKSDEEFKEAKITGMYREQETLEAKIAKAQLTGDFEGTKTLQAQQFQLNKDMAYADLSGTYWNPETNTWEQTFAREQYEDDKEFKAASLTGWYEKKKTLDHRMQEAVLTGDLDGVATISQKQYSLNRAIAESDATGLWYNEETGEYVVTLKKQDFAHTWDYNEAVLLGYYKEKEQVTEAAKKRQLDEKIADMNYTGHYRDPITGVLKPTIYRDQFDSDEAYKTRMAELQEGIALSEALGIYRNPISGEFEVTIRAEDFKDISEYRKKDFELRSAIANAEAMGYWKNPLTGNIEPTIRRSQYESDETYRADYFEWQKEIGKVTATGYWKDPITGQLEPTLDREKFASDEAYNTRLADIQENIATANAVGFYMNPSTGQLEPTLEKSAYQDTKRWNDIQSAIAVGNTIGTYTDPETGATHITVDMMRFNSDEDYREAVLTGIVHTEEGDVETIEKKRLDMQKEFGQVNSAINIANATGQLTVTHPITGEIIDTTTLEAELAELNEEMTRLDGAIAVSQLVGYVTEGVSFEYAGKPTWSRDALAQQLASTGTIAAATGDMTTKDWVNLGFDVGEAGLLALIYSTQGAKVAADAAKVIKGGATTLTGATGTTEAATAAATTVTSATGPGVGTAAIAALPVVAAAVVTGAVIVGGAYTLYQAGKVLWKGWFGEESTTGQHRYPTDPGEETFNRAAQQWQGASNEEKYAMAMYELTYTFGQGNPDRAVERIEDHGSSLNEEIIQWIADHDNLYGSYA